MHVINRELIRHTRILDIIGDMIRVRAADVSLGDLAVVEHTDGDVSLAQVVSLERDIVNLQVFSGSKGLSTQAGVRFLGHYLEITYSENVLGRVYGDPESPSTAVPIFPPILK